MTATMMMVVTTTTTARTTTAAISVELVWQWSKHKVAGAELVLRQRKS